MPMAPYESSLEKYSYEDLSQFTDAFSEANFIRDTMFGKIYHGKIVKDMKVVYVTIKIWVDHELYEVEPEEKISRMGEEVYLLQNEELKSHPNLVKLIGYCSEGEHVESFMTLNPLVLYIPSFLKVAYVDAQVETFLAKPKHYSYSFTWLRRIKVAVGLACVIDFFHNAKHGSIGYLLRNIGPRHVILDEDFSPRIIDFGMVSGGVLADKRNIETEKVDGCYGYFDPGFALPGRWSKECDIFSYGAVLIGLLTNKVYDEEGYLFQNASFCDLFVWAEDALLKNKVTNAIGRTKCLLVHENLRTDEGFRRSDGYQITELMMRCISSCHFFRPSMNEVVKCLLRLHVVQKNADFIGAKDKVNSYMMLEMLRDYIKGSNLFRDQYNRTWRYKAKKMLLHSRTA